MLKLLLLSAALFVSVSLNSKPFFTFQGTSNPRENVTVTLQVNMQYQDVSPDGVFLIGYLISNDGLPLTNIGNSIWEISLTQEVGFQMKYRFVNGIPNQGGQSEVFTLPYPPCTCGDQVHERCLVVPDSDTTLQVCFQYCSQCPNLIISEVASPLDNVWDGAFIELYNPGTEPIDFTTNPVFVWKTDQGSEERLTGVLPSNGKYVIGSYFFEDVYGFAPDLIFTDLYDYNSEAVGISIGNDLYSFTVIDKFGQTNCTGTKAVRLRSVTEPAPVYDSAQWNKPVEANIVNMTPGAHNEDVSWNSSSSTTWSTMGNWTGLNNYIPDASFNVEIPVSGVQPLVTGEAACNNLDILAGGMLDLPVNTGLTVFGDLTIETGGNFTIESDGAGQGSLITYGSVSGNTTVNKVIGDEEWHLISTPVADATADVFYDSYLQYYTESTGAWGEITSYLTPLEPMQGYALFGVPPARNSYEFTGLLNSGIQDFDFTASQPNGWNLVGNPYPSAIDWDQVSIPDGMNSAIYFLDAATGTYVSYLDNDFPSAPPYIPAMQGFWISANEAGTLTLDPGDLTHNGSAMYYKSGATLSNYIELEAVKGQMIDKTYIRFKSEATAAFDGKYDAFKLAAVNEDYPQLFTLAGDDRLSINQLTFAEAIPAGFVCGQSGEFTIRLAKMNNIARCLIEDLETGSMTDLQKTPYTFNYQAGDNPERFVIHLGITGTGDLPGDGSVKIYAQGGDIILDSSKQQDGTFLLTDLSGRTIIEQQVSGSGPVRIHAGLPKGIYLATLISGEGNFTRKIIL